MNRTFRFAAFELDVAAYALKHRGRPVKLERIPMEVLIFLVQRAGTLVERSDIQAHLWSPDVFIEHEAAINTAVRKIRHALGDDAEAPRFVETVVGKGYRFIALLEERSLPGAAAFPRYALTVGKQEFVLHSRDTVLGRDPSAGIYVDHPSVSRRHARISIESRGPVVQDLGSRNGTFVNGRRIDGPAKIHHKSIIGLGSIAVVFSILRRPASTQSMSGSVIGK
jgi:DNA-binding winged helix-turn-helix (wHTH) protein